MNFGLNDVGTYLQRNTYHIPNYQREYAWTAEGEVEDFWLDMEATVQEKRDSHFFGQIVIHADTENGRKYIIDGQQRTATAVIFLAVLRDYFKKLSASVKGALNKYEDIRIKYIGRWSEEEDELRLRLGEIDGEFFAKNVQINMPSENPGKESHKNIVNAYKYLERKMIETVQDSKDEKKQYDIIYEYYSKFINNFKVMYIETDDENEAFIIFETLNARGRDLETADLLKNHVFRKSGKSLDKVKENWSNTVDTLDNIDITKFLRHYWNSKATLVREKDLYKKIRDDITTPNKCEEFTKVLASMAEVYKGLVYPLIEGYFSEPLINQTLNNLKIMNASSFYPIMLALVQRKFEDKDILIIAQSIETLIFRNCVVAGKVANKYEIVFSRIAHKISEKELTTVEEINAEIRKETIGDLEFKPVFMIFAVKSTPVAKYVLREINDFQNDEVKALDNSKLNLEHIMPKTKGDWQVDKETHEKYLYRLGNLTLLAEKINKGIQNKIFDSKKPVYERSKLTITNMLKDFSKWDPDSIDVRQERLYDIAIKRWPL